MFRVSRNNSTGQKLLLPNSLHLSQLQKDLAKTSNSFSLFLVKIQFQMKQVKHLVIILVWTFVTSSFNTQSIQYV